MKGEISPNRKNSNWRLHRFGEISPVGRNDCSCLLHFLCLGKLATDWYCNGNNDVLSYVGTFVGLPKHLHSNLMHSPKKFLLLAVRIQCLFVLTLLFPNHGLSQVINNNSITVCVDARANRGVLVPPFLPGEEPTAVTFDLIMAPNLWEFLRQPFDTYVHRWVKIDLPPPIPAFGNAICITPPCDICGLQHCCASDRWPANTTPKCTDPRIPKHDHVSVWIHHDFKGLYYNVVFCNIPKPRYHLNPQQPNVVGVRQVFWAEARNFELPWHSFPIFFKDDRNSKVGLQPLF